MELAISALELFRGLAQKDDCEHGRVWLQDWDPIFLEFKVPIARNGEQAWKCLLTQV
jgi:hypothetical protein